MKENQPILEVKDINKSFALTQVLDHVQFQLKPGELHALMGENGAGKSTLMKIIMGIYEKDSGSIFFNGEEVNFKTSREALHAGISMIHQELSPIPEMTVAENIFLGREIKKIKGLPFVDKKALNRKTFDLLKKYNMDRYIEPTMKMKNLNIAQVQMMEIIKAVSYNAKVIIMDEPTSSLTEKETQVLFDIISNLKKQNVGIIYISHRMEEIFDISDRISVLRDGQFIRCVKTQEATKDELIGMMVGRELSKGYPSNNRNHGDVILEIKNFNREHFFKDINFNIHSGEILGFYGLVGAGRSEVMRAVVGYDKRDSGDIILEGKPIKINSPKQAINHNIIMTPEDRKNLGIVLCRTIRENVSLQNFNKMTQATFIQKAKERQLVNKHVEEMNTKKNSIEDLVASLSGGNQQKVVLAKSLLSEPKVLIMDEPTRGIDIGAKAAIYDIIVELAKRGIAIIMITSELPELIGMSDRIIVMAGGRITGELVGKEEFSQEEIVKLAFGEAKNGK